MKAARVSFMQMMLFIRRDMMLFASCAAPLLAGVFFRFAVPVMERALVSWTGRTEVLAPYYGLFDLIFSMLAPIMFCFVTAMFHHFDLAYFSSGGNSFYHDSYIAACF